MRNHSGQLARWLQNRNGSANDWSQVRPCSNVHERAHDATTGRSTTLDDVAVSAHTEETCGHKFEALIAAVVLSFRDPTLTGFGNRLTSNHTADHPVMDPHHSPSLALSSTVFRYSLHARGNVMRGTFDDIFRELDFRDQVPSDDQRLSK